MMKFIFFKIFFLSIVYSTTNAQNFQTNLARYSQDFGDERLYIHYDKSAYAPGESIWFKVYIMAAVFPAEKSKSVYLDWTDENGKLLERTSSPLVEGTSYGQFEVPADFKGQYLHVKAYTRWMLNFDSAFLYNKDIRILSDLKTPASVKSKVITQLNFFPEGGDMVAGITNKIAFKANDQFGRPVAIQGIIQDSKGITVDSLRPIHDGMGFFYLKPSSTETFTAKWKAGNGALQVTSLPAIKPLGVGIQVGNIGKNKSFLVTGSNNYTESNSTFHVLGTMYQQPVFTISKQFNEGSIQGLVPTNDLPTGILTITVFDNNWQPLAERITYINNEEHLFEPEMSVQHWGLNKRARNEIEIIVPDSLVANLSISVTDMAIGADSGDHIISHLLLSGELKGKVYKPAYYFSNNSDSIAHHLDLLMLTHGWRRFNWEDVAKGNFPKISYPRDTSYLSISGKIYGASSVQLRDAGSIVLLYNQGDQENQIFSVPISGDGSFNDPALILFDTAKIYYQLPKNKGLDGASVQFMQNRLSALGSNVKASGINSNINDTSGYARHFQLSEALLDELKYYEGKVLETVTIKAKGKSELELMDEKYASGMFQGGDGYQFDLRTDPRAMSSMSIFNYLQGQVAGLQINTTGNPPSINWRGGTPAIFLNEMQSSPEMIANISVSDVAYIKVIRPPFVGATGGGANGAIAIYTRRGDDVASQPGQGLSNNTVTGYTSIRQFYSPDYSTLNEEHEKKDFRTTLYWNPEIITRPGGNKVLVTFYNNDVSESFRVVLEGITTDGRLAHVEMLME